MGTNSVLSYSAISKPSSMHQTLFLVSLGQKPIDSYKTELESTTPWICVVLKLSLSKVVLYFP